MFIAALLTIAKLWKEPKCPLTDEWIKKVWYTHAHTHTHTHTHWNITQPLKRMKSVICNDIDGTTYYYAK